VTNTSVSDRGLGYIAQISNLRSLSLYGTSVTTPGMVKLLPKMTQMEELALGYSTSDQVLKSLTGLKNLKMLDLGAARGGGVTPAGIEELQKALPDCSIKAR
jgi:hypothetical protein